METKCCDKCKRETDNLNGLHVWCTNEQCDCHRTIPCPNCTTERLCEGHKTIPNPYMTNTTCDRACAYQEPYGFVPEADCPVHDVPKTAQQIFLEGREQERLVKAKHSTMATMTAAEWIQKADRLIQELEGVKKQIDQIQASLDYFS